MQKADKFKNGLGLLHYPAIDTQVFIVGLIAKTGLIYENSLVKPGILYLIERLLYSGTDKYSSNRQISLMLESLGGRLHTVTGQETFQIYLEVPYYNQFKAISFLANLIQYSNFDNSDIESQKQYLKNWLVSKQNSNNLETEGSEIQLRSFYLGNRYNEINSTITLDSLLNITRAEITDYYSRQFSPENCHLVLSGKYDDTELDRIVEQEWGFWNPKTRYTLDIRNEREDIAIALPNVDFRQRGQMHTEINFGFLIDNNPQDRFLNPETREQLNGNELELAVQEYIIDVARLMILNNVLGQGISSKLWTKGVDETMYFYQISSDVSVLKNCNYLEISGILEHNMFTFGLECVLMTLKDLTRDTIAINEILKAKEVIKSKFILSHENLLNKTLWQVDNYLLTGMNLELDELIKVIQKVGANEIRTLADNIFRQNKLQLVILGTAKETRTVKNLIEKYLRQL